jgi:glycopeptide antibiotics resistance protein
MTHFLPWLDNLSLLVAGGFIALLLALPYVWSKRHSWTYIAVFAVFWMYIVLVIGLTLLPRPFEFTHINRQSASYILSRINLVPTFLDGSLHFRLRGRFDLVTNILMTMPIGFLLPMVFRIRPRQFLWIAFLPGLIIETTQLIFSFLIGYDYRTVDITDVITNTVGMFLGYSIFLAFIWIYRKLTQSPKGGTEVIKKSKHPPHPVKN